MDALVSTNGVVPAHQPPGQAFIDHVNLRQVVRPERLWETRGSRLPLRGVIRLWISVGSLLEHRPRRRSPTGRGPRAVSAEVSLIRKERGYYSILVQERADFGTPNNIKMIQRTSKTYLLPYGRIARFCRTLQLSPRNHDSSCT
jgi:hypothetical protein